MTATRAVTQARHGPAPSGKLRRRRPPVDDLGYGPRPPRLQPPYAEQRRDQLNHSHISRALRPGSRHSVADPEHPGQHITRRFRILHIRNHGTVTVVSRGYRGPLPLPFTHRKRSWR